MGAGATKCHPNVLKTAKVASVSSGTKLMRLRMDPRVHDSLLRMFGAAEEVRLFRKLLSFCDAFFLTAVFWFLSKES